VVVGHPQGNRVAPVAVAADRPVARVSQPVSETLFFRKLGHPVGLVVVDEKLGLEVLDSHEPARHGLVQERRVRSPAERVRVLQGGLGMQALVVLEVLDDVLVGVFDVLAGEVADILRKQTTRVDRTDDWAFLVDDIVG